MFGTGFPKSRAPKLKPAAEHWILIKAPGELRELRIEENRIGTTDKLVRPCIVRKDNTVSVEVLGAGVQIEPSGRWPANSACLS